MEGIDGLVRLPEVLIAAPDVAQVRRVHLVRVELGIEIERFLILPSRECLPRFDLALVRVFTCRLRGSDLQERLANDRSGEQDL